MRQVVLHSSPTVKLIPLLQGELLNYLRAPPAEFHAAQSRRVILPGFLLRVPIFVGARKIAFSLSLCGKAVHFCTCNATTCA